ncbi:MAG TPA: pitrilysin family protein [Acidobacteriota bacterium]
MTAALLSVALLAGLPVPQRSIQRHALDHGVQVVLEVDRAVAAVAACVLVGAGGGSEDGSELGAAHFLEHLAFRGGISFGPGELRRRLMEQGGSAIAATSRDWTMYLALAPKEALPLALEGLADAVLHMRFDPESIEAERSLLRQEYEQREQRLSTAAEERIFALGFPEHGYGRTSAESNRMLRDHDAVSLRRFHQRYYSAERMVVAVVGDFDPAATLEWIRRGFASASQLPGSLSASARPRTGALSAGAGRLKGGGKPRPYVSGTADARPSSADWSAPALNPPDIEPREEVIQAHASSLRLGFVVAGSRHPDLPALLLLAEILGGGETARLWQEAVHRRRLATSCEATLIPYQQASLLELGAEALERRDLAELEQILLQALLELRRAPVGAAELERARGAIVRRRLFELEDYGYRVQTLAIAELAGDLGFSLGLDRELETVTPQQLLETARRYLVSNRMVTLRLRERGAADSPKADRAAAAALRRELPNGEPIDWEARRNPPAPRLTVAARPGSEDATIREQRLDSGLKLVLLHDPSLPRVQLLLAAPAGTAFDPPGHEGLAVLTNSLLRAGAGDWDRDQIAERFAALGGTYGFSSSRDLSSARITAAAAELAPALELLATVWSDPRFPAPDLERERRALIERVQRRQDSPAAAADSEARARLYGDHPYHRDLAGDADALRRLRREDVLEFHRRHYRPSASVLVVVGDFDAERLRGLAGARFGLGPAAAAPPATLAALPQPRFGEVRRRRQWSDAFLLLCAPVPSLGDPRFVELLTLQRLLALRNFERLIYQHSLVYQHATSLSNHRLGAELCVEAQLPSGSVGAARREIRSQLEALSRGHFEADELDAARRWALGSLRLERMSAASRAQTLASLALFDLPAALYGELPQRLEAVSLEGARRSAAAFLDPERWVWVRIEP